MNIQNKSNNVDMTSDIRRNNQHDITARKPNDMAGIEVSSFIKIFDPESGQVIAQVRGDL